VSATAQVIAFPTRHTSEPWVSKRQLANHWGVSTKTVERRVVEGMPSRPPAESPTNRRMFRISECDNWLKARAA
jgi:hypothetical protein